MNYLGNVGIVLVLLLILVMGAISLGGLVLAIAAGTSPGIAWYWAPVGLGAFVLVGGAILTILDLK